MPKLLIFDAFTLLIREKTVTNYALLQCKTFSLKIWVCKIFDKFHVCSEGPKKHHYLKPCRNSFAVHWVTEITHYTNAKNNAKFDLKLMCLQISISRTPKEIPVTKIHTKYLHTGGFHLPFDQSDLARTRFQPSFLCTMQYALCALSARPCNLPRRAPIPTFSKAAPPPPPIMFRLIKQIRPSDLTVLACT